MTPHFEKATFKTRYINSLHERQGYSNGVLGISKVGNAGYKLTHIASCKDVSGHYFPLRRDAVKAANLLTELLGIDALASMDPFFGLDGDLKDAVIRICKGKA